MLPRGVVKDFPCRGVGVEGGLFPPKPCAPPRPLGSPLGWQEGLQSSGGELRGRAAAAEDGEGALRILQAELVGPFFPLELDQNHKLMPGHVAIACCGFLLVAIDISVSACESKATPPTMNW